MTRKALPLFLVALALLVVPACDIDDDVIEIKLGHGWDASHPVHVAMEYMGERLAEKSGGTMRIDVYPSEQLGSERELLELLQIGSLAMTKVSAAVMEGFAPAFRVFSVPYLFRDDAHRFEVLEGEIGRELLLAGEKFWLRGLNYYDAGSRSFYTKTRHIERPEDLAGLKIRTLESTSSIQMVNHLGGSATPISWGELYSALQQGVVDGAENNPPSFYLSYHYEVCKYYSLDEHTSIPDIVLISTKIWNRLDPEQQQWLEEAAFESELYQKELWRQATEEALAAVQAAGVQVIRPDKAPFIERVQPMYEGYRSQPEIYSLIERIRAVDPEAAIASAEDE
jgi:tripartite ATP-independent transporter DctP family solute receptor